MKIIENRVKLISFSLVIILSGFLAMFIYRFMNNEAMLNFGIEFTGGTVMKVDIGKEFVKEDIQKIVYDITKSEDIQVQRVQGTNEAVIKYQISQSTKKEGKNNKAQAAGNNEVTTTNDLAPDANLPVTTEEKTEDIQTSTAEPVATDVETTNTQETTNTEGLMTEKYVAQSDYIAKIISALSERYELTEEAFISTEDIAPTIGFEMQMNALVSVLLGVAFILAYITYRFKDYKFGVAAVIALIHDVLVVFAVYSVLRIPINNAFVAAQLTIIGYSINDTIIVFDRIRENKRALGKTSLENLINTSISETFSRSISTSITTLITIAAVYILGGATIRDFALPLMVGVAAGTYSSIAVASPMWYELTKKAESK